MVNGGSIVVPDLHSIAGIASLIMTLSQPLAKGRIHVQLLNTSVGSWTDRWCLFSSCFRINRPLRVHHSQWHQRSDCWRVVKISFRSLMNSCFRVVYLDSGMLSCSDKSMLWVKLYPWFSIPVWTINPNAILDNPGCCWLTQAFS